MTLEGKRILLGVSGGIAAFKAPTVLRELAKRGADVRVVMTRSARQFVTDTTLEVLSRHRVHTDMFARDEDFPVLHVGLAAWADLVLLAPATANLMAKMAAGIADDLLTSLLLSTRARIVVVPSMEEHMLEHPATQASARLLAERGCVLLQPESGELASGLTGRGRLPEPDEIVRQVVALIGATADLEGLSVLVTAGPTVEEIDPVRFISNRSSGKMGYAVAQAARRRGARVFLVSGPTHLPCPAGVELRRVRSTQEMQRECEALFDQVDAAVMAAAPVDFRPRQPAAEKIHRGAEALHLELVPTPDIAAGLGARKQRQVLVVFALESEAGQERARDKLTRKNADLVVLNSLCDEGAGFEVDTNVVTLIDRQGQAQGLPRMAKGAVAEHLVEWLGQACRRRT